MAVVEIKYDAKCKHCKHCEVVKRKAQCKIDGPILFGLKTKACENFEL